MNYFFILGRTPALSLLELAAMLTHEPALSIMNAGNETALVSGPGNFREEEYVRVLGGVIKGGRIIASAEKDTDAAAAVIARDLSARAERISGRVTFGLSAYSVSQKPLKGNLPAAIQRMGITLKKELAKTAPARFVAPRRGERILSSVVVEKNHLTTDPNAEYVLLFNDDAISVGITSAVQEFEEYSRRDYNRPHRDMKTGLLPPKLARAMVNLAGLNPHKAPVIFDPFCGLGTILQEALLLGFAHVWGSDIDAKNVRATQENLAWLGKEMRDTVVKKCDAKNLLSCFQKNSVDAIVTEPTLGPALSTERPSVSLSEINLLCSLYVASFKIFREILKDNGRVVIVFPVWMRRGTPVFISCIDDIVASGFINITIPASLKHSLTAKTSRDSILISRPDARVARELFIFQKTTC